MNASQKVVLDLLEERLRRAHENFVDTSRIFGTGSFPASQALDRAMAWEEAIKILEQTWRGA